MAKPLGTKTLLIRDAIKAHPDKGNTELAELINNSPARKDDKIEVTANDIAKQKQALKNLPASEPAAPAPGRATASAAPTTAKKRGRPVGARQPAKAPPAPTGPTSGVPSPAALIDEVLALANRTGGIEELKQLVEKIAEVQKR